MISNASLKIVALAHPFTVVWRKDSTQCDKRGSGNNHYPLHLVHCRTPAKQYIFNAIRVVSALANSRPVGCHYMTWMKGWSNRRLCWRAGGVAVARVGNGPDSPGEVAGVWKTGCVASNGRENPVLVLRGPRQGIKMPKMANLGSGGAKNDRDEGAEGKNGPQRGWEGRKGVLGPQMDANSRKWGIFRAQPEGWTTYGAGYVVHASAWGFVGRGCIPGGIGAERRPASRERLAYNRSGGQKSRKSGPPWRLGPQIHANGKGVSKGVSPMK